MYVLGVAQMSGVKRGREENTASSAEQASALAKEAAAFNERDKLVSQVEMLVMKHQRSFDAISATLNKLRVEEMKEKLKVEVAFAKKKNEQVIAPRRALLSRIKGFWPAVLMKAISDDNCPVRVLVGGDQDFPVISHVTDYSYSEVEGGETGNEEYTVSLTLSPNAYLSNDVITTRVCLPAKGPMTVECTRMEWKEGHSLEEFGGDDSFFSVFDASVEMDGQLDFLNESHSTFKGMHEDPLAVLQEDMDDDEDDDDDDDDEDDDDDDDDGDDDDENKDGK